MMKEEYLHYLHRFRLLGDEFETTNGQQLKILDFGLHNTNSGPDFSHGKINLDGQVWAGPIEFHVRSSDWYAHGHQHDPAYHNVIAHFVYEHDAEVRTGSYILPTVELKGKIDIRHFGQYAGLAGSPANVPCSGRLKELDPFVIFQQKERALAQRLMRKSALILDDLKNHQGDLEKAFYLALARVFGGKVNAEPFEELVAKINLQDLRRISGTEHAISAVLFGASGLLPVKSGDHFVQRLITEFGFQKHRLRIVPMSATAWRYSRMHPQGFPDIRLAQFAALLEKNNPPEVFLETGISVKRVRHLFNVKLPAWWDDHYRFANPTAKKKCFAGSGLY